MTRRHSQETKDKISVAQKGRKYPGRVGKKGLSPEGIERLRNRVFTDEHRQKISETRRRNYQEKIWRELAARFQ